MWMGGQPPLGYDAHERKLAVNQEEAQTVRHIYARYAALGSVRAAPSVPDAPPSDRRPVTVPQLAEMKQRGEPIVMVTAYDFPSAQVAEEAGVDLILVGDTAAMTVLGYGSTVPVSMDEMIMACYVSHESLERGSVVRCSSPLQKIRGVRVAERRSKPCDSEPFSERLAQGLP